MKNWGWGGEVHGEDLMVQMWKVDPNESGSLEHFPFVRWYVDLFEGPDGYTLEEEVYLESIEEA